jgi:hypothetical protein
MNENIAQEILHELFSSLEALETQSTGILQFLKDKGLATEAELAPHFEQAGKASNVRWRAARVRIDYLLASALKTDELDTRKASSKTTETSPDQSNARAETSPPKETGKDSHGTEKTAIEGKAQTDNTDTAGAKGPTQERDGDKPASNDVAKSAA